MDASLRKKIKVAVANLLKEKAGKGLMAHHRRRSASRARSHSRSRSIGRGGELVLPLDRIGGRLRSRSRSKSIGRSRSRSIGRKAGAVVLSGLGARKRSLSRGRRVSTPAQKHAHALAKKAMEYKVKHGVTLKQAWAHIRK